MKIKSIFGMFLLLVLLLSVAQIDHLSPNKKAVRNTEHDQAKSTSIDYHDSIESGSHLTQFNQFTSPTQIKPDLVPNTSAGYIVISSNSQLASYAASGSGATNDPYYLDTTTYMHYYFNISNTNAYLVITGIDIFHYGEYTNNKTMYSIRDSSNILITNNVFKGGDTTISILRSTNVNVTNNDIEGLEIGIELAGVRDSTISGNTFNSGSAIYFSYLERVYSKINSGTYSSSQNLNIKDNIYYRGGIDVFFLLRNSQSSLFSFNLINNTYIAADNSRHPYLFIFNEDFYNLRDVTIAGIIVINLNTFTMTNVKSYSSIYLENINVVTLDNVTYISSSNVYSYLDASLTLQSIGTSTIVKSHFFYRTKVIPLSRTSGYFNTPSTRFPVFSEQFANFFIFVNHTIGLQATQNLFNATYSTLKTTIYLNMSSNYQFEGNDLLGPMTNKYTPSLNTVFPIYPINSNSGYVVNNNFINNDTYIEAMQVIDPKAVYDFNYYSSLNASGADGKIGVDANGDGIYDSPFKVNASWIGNIYDMHPRSQPHDILDFKLITTYSTSDILRGFAALSWSINSSSLIPVDYHLEYNSGSGWVVFDSFSDPGAKLNHTNIDTRQFANGTYQLRLNASSYYSFFGTTRQQSLVFAATFYNELNPPVVTITSPTTQYINQSSVTIGFDVSKLVETYYYSINGSQQVVFTGVSLSLDLVDGTYNITIIAEDIYNNTGYDSVIITTDTIAPEITVLNTVKDVYTNDEVVWINVTVSEPVSLYFSISGNVSYIMYTPNLRLTLFVGTYNVSITAFDFAGNSLTKYFAFEVVNADTQTTSPGFTQITDSTSSSQIKSRTENDAIVNVPFPVLFFIIPMIGIGMMRRLKIQQI